SRATAAAEERARADETRQPREGVRVGAPGARRAAVRRAVRVAARRLRRRVPGAALARLALLDERLRPCEVERAREEVREAGRRRVDVPEVVLALAAARDDADHRARLLADRRAARVALADRQPDLEFVGPERRLALRHALPDREHLHRVLLEPRP